MTNEARKSASGVEDRDEPQAQTWAKDAENPKKSAGKVLVINTGSGILGEEETRYYRESLLEFI